MSVVVKGVVDLPFIDFKDQLLEEVLLLFHENGLINLTGWELKRKGNFLEITHKGRNWSWIRIYENGTIEYDKHYKETEEFYSTLLDCIQNYYPMFRKALEIVKQSSVTNYSLEFSDEKVILEVYES